MIDSTRSVGLGGVVVEDPLGDVLEVGHAEDVVEVLADDRDARVAAAQASDIAWRSVLCRSM